MTIISTFNKTGTIAKKIPHSSSDIIPVFENNSSFNLDNIVSYNLFVKNFKAYAKIRSVPIAPMPILFDEDNETVRIQKILDIEWRTPRKQIDLFISNGEIDSTWETVGSVSLLNPSGYPYRSYNLLDIYTANLAIELGEKGKIGVKITDVGYGLLQPEDEVTIHGSYVQEISVASEGSTGGIVNPPTITPIEMEEVKIEIASGLSTLIANSNPDRIYLLLQNISNDETCWITFANGEAVENAGLKIPAGGHYEFSTKDIPYFGEIKGICGEGTATILKIEG